MGRPLAIICTLAVGGFVALQPPANAALAEHVGDLAAALISTAISLFVLALLLLAFADPARLSGLVAFRPEYAVGGLAGASVVAVSLVTVRPLGVAGVVSLLVAGQIVVSVVADRFGWFGVPEIGMSAGRWAGVALVVAGTVLITRT